MSRAQCSECPSSFELVPPADPEYSIPKLGQPSDPDYIKRIYECDDEKHRNTVWWTRPKGSFQKVGGFRV
jgi:hypothetical protein